MQINRLFEMVYLLLSRENVTEGEMAYRVYDEFPDCELLTDGSFKATLTMPRGEWIYHYITTFGEHCEVLEPSDIRLQIKEKLQKTLEQYLKYDMLMSIYV